MTNFRLLLWAFYKPLLAINCIATLYTLKIIVIDRLFSLPLLVLVKLLGYACGTGYQYVAASQQYYFYRNAGYRVRKLYLQAYLLDFSVFILAITSCQLIVDAAFKHR